MKRAIYLAAALILACAATGCGEGKESSNSYTLTQENMEYGATITELRPSSDENVKIMVGFDNRFFGGSGEEKDFSDIYSLCDCVAGFNTNDHQLIKDHSYPGYLDSVAATTGAAGADEYLDSYVEKLTNALGEGFEIDYIDISKCLGESDSEAASYFETVDNTLTEIAGADILNKVTSRKLVYIGGDTSYTLPTGTYRLINHASEMAFCLYRIDGEYYIF